MAIEPSTSSFREASACHASVVVLKCERKSICGGWWFLPPGFGGERKCLKPLRERRCSIAGHQDQLRFQHHDRPAASPRDAPVSPRESNFAFPAQITPVFEYILKDTIEEIIRRILTRDDGLERLVLFLAFQCVVNIGVRGSEPIRSSVVQAGTLDVVGCVLEGWLAWKGSARLEWSRESGGRKEALANTTKGAGSEACPGTRLSLALERLLANVEEYAVDEDMSELGQDNNEQPHPARRRDLHLNRHISERYTPRLGNPTGSVVVPGRDSHNQLWNAQPLPQPKSLRLSRRRTLRSRQPQQDADDWLSSSAKFKNFSEGH
ncbi:hypothetical protein BD410DRAFT_810063 [Rickenella mellea]|uniref:Uncharacterized protein n=1 Tax=Rickenella mellea TaxID=50990 RepID=A0A4Y7PF30_9AGAM|nr:hypothetical protein BD410DRAFT_810063 [Rickenella mellea]